MSFDEELKELEKYGPDGYFDEKTGEPVYPRLVIVWEPILDSSAREG